MSSEAVPLATAGEPSEDDGSAPRRHGIALCLSGGGYRAALFHLGAARRLHEVGLLARLDTLSSVSGGSIFAGVLAQLAIERGWRDGLVIEDYDRDVAERVRALTRVDLRTMPFLLNVGWNWALPSVRARHLERLLAKHLTRARIEDLPERPRFVFCATDVVYGVSWESSRARVGSWQSGYLRDGAQWPLARAIAASACFPPIFGPLAVGRPDADFVGGQAPRDGKLRRRVALSDGGVYDNMGLEPVWKDHACVMVSDGGAPFEFVASRNPLRRLLRYTSVVTNQAQSVRRRMFFAGITDKRYSGTRWGIRSAAQLPPGYSVEMSEARIRTVRTDLDRFTVAEQCVLENHGYCVAEDALRRHVPDLLAADQPRAAPPHPEWMDEKRASHALRHSARRLSVERMLGGGRA